jgi:signal peptidase I
MSLCSRYLPDCCQGGSGRKYFFILFVYMLSLELCKKPSSIELPTELPVAEKGPERGQSSAEEASNAPSAGQDRVPAKNKRIAAGQAQFIPEAQFTEAQFTKETRLTEEAPLTKEAQLTAESSAKNLSDWYARIGFNAKHVAPLRRLLHRSTRRLVLLASIVLCIRIFVGEASVVPTASMEGTILVGDHLFMDKLLYGPEIPLVHWRLPVVKTVHRGDIIVFRYPKDLSETFLKRVAAVGGDRLEIRDGMLYVNSHAVLEPYAVHHPPLHSTQENWGPIVVPEGKLFVMGDNRDNSSDSRDWGFVPIGNVIGEPLFVYWSYDAPTSRWLDENPGHRISFYASIAENFFSNTRWNRTGMLL